MVIIENTEFSNDRLSSLLTVHLVVHHSFPWIKVSSTCTPIISFNLGTEVVVLSPVNQGFVLS